jgi:hypothetical protein
MLRAKFVQELLRRPGASGSDIFQTARDPFCGFLEILFFPFQITGNNFIERIGRRLAVPHGVFFERLHALSL